MGTKLAERVSALYGELGSWDAVGEALGCSAAAAWKVAHGKSRAVTVRKATGIEYRYRDRLASSLAPKEAQAVRDELGGMSVTEFWREWLRSRGKI